MKNLLKLAAAAVALSIATADAHENTGRQLDLIADPVDTVTVPSAGGIFTVNPVVGIFWDERCASVEYTFNSNAGANVGTPDEISPAVLAATVQTGLDRWNGIPTSFIEMNITSVTDLGPTPRAGGDFVNEVTFITPADFTALASSPSTSLTADTTFVVGDDLDGDGDSDVFDPIVEGVNTCTDIDSDGDIEFPAGFYKAGTIMDNDVQFSSTETWELTPTSTVLPDGSSLIDVDGISTHEFGHSHGLNHSLINQLSSLDGTGSTMFPFIDVSDAASELGARSLSSDDIAASSFLYPEGSSPTGIAALQAGDVSFAAAFDVISGTTEIAGAPLAGAHVTAVTEFEVVEAGTYSGSSVVFGDTFGGLFAFPESTIDGDWVMAVPNGTYVAAIEAVDGDPVPPPSIGVNVIVADINGQTSFPEEFQNGASESSVEFSPGDSTGFTSGSLAAQSLSFIANEETIQRTAGDIDFIGTGDLAGATSVVYAELLDRTEVETRLAAGDVPVSGNFQTGTLDSSLVPAFDDAKLVFGTINPDGTAALGTTITSVGGFIGQDDDFTPFFFPGSETLPFTIREAFDADPALQLFLVLSADGLVAGPSGFPPNFLSIDIDALTSTSFASFDGSPLAPISGAWGVELRYTNDGSPVSPALLP